MRSHVRSLSIDEPFVRQTGTGNEFYHTDALGSSLALSNPQGASGTMYTYEPFGKATATGVSTNAVQFTGRENDGTGLMYYRARYYSPILQRFISQDPLGLGGGSNYYSYAKNSPMRFMDPRGLFAGWRHSQISKQALQAEGCSNDFINKAVKANTETDHDPDYPTFDPNNAHWHGQQGPNDPTVTDAIRASNARINQQMSLGTPEGLGTAMHSTEDPFSRSHQWSPALPEPSLTDPANWGDWFDHWWADNFPSDDEMARAAAADRRLIKLWKKMHGGRKDTCQ